MVEPRYKAASLVTVRRWLSERGLEARFLATIDPQLADRYRRLVATDWAPISDAEAIYEAAAPLLHPDDVAPARRLGAELARDHLRGIYRFAFRFMTVDFAMQQTARLWRMYNDTGTLSIVESHPRSLRAVLTGYPDYPPTVRETVAGYIAGAIELTGATELRMTTSNGPSEVVFLLRWR